MKCHLNGKVVEVCDLLEDDTVRDAALKLTRGSGQVSLYAKRTKTNTPVTVWEKYKRPLSPAEMTGELRNVGILRRVEVKTFDFEEVLEIFPKETQWEYVPLGQTLPCGVRVKPPSEGYTIEEFRDVTVSAQTSSTRLFEYENITDIYAVHLTFLTHVYLLHPPGLVPENIPLPERFSWVWEVRPELRYVPKNPQTVDLGSLFQRIHAHAIIPVIVYGNNARVINSTTEHLLLLQKTNLKPNGYRTNNKQHLTVCFADNKRIAFYDDGTVHVSTDDPPLMNPIINYVNNILRWETGLEGDYKIIGKRIGDSPVFSDAFFPLCKSDGEKRVTLQTSWSGETPSEVPYRWSTAFDDAFHYLRCSPSALLEFKGTDKEKEKETTVVLSNLHPRCAVFAAKYTEAFIIDEIERDKDKEHDYFIEEVDKDKEQTHQQPKDKKIVLCYGTTADQLERAGFQVEGRFLGGIYATSPKGFQGLVPMSDDDDAGVVSHLEEWHPNQGYANTKAFLEEVSSLFPGLRPTTYVTTVSSVCTGFRTLDGTVVRCLGDRVISKNETNTMLEHEILFPKVPRLYGLYREVYKACITKVKKKKTLQQNQNQTPKINQCEHRVADTMAAVVLTTKVDQDQGYFNDKLILTKPNADLFCTQLEDELARFHRVRSYAFDWVQKVNGIDHDLLCEEKIVSIDALETILS